MLGNLPAPDGTKIQSRIEVYTCKAAGNDKKLLKHLESKFTPEETTDKSKCYSARASSKLSLEDENQASSPSQAIINAQSGLNVKTFYYLISTMNNMFPDYDFRQVENDYSA